MTCREFREEIELTVGSTEISTALRDHIKECDKCRYYFEQMSEMADILSDETPFLLTVAEEKRLVANIEARIAPAHQTEIVSLRWVRYAGVAAVVLLSFVGVTGYMRGWFGGTAVGLDSLKTVATTTDTSAVIDTSYSAAGLSDDFLAGAISSGDDLFLGSSGAVLDSLSEDEVKYLETHFDVKDVL